MQKIAVNNHRDISLERNLNWRLEREMVCLSNRSCRRNQIKRDFKAQSRSEKTRIFLLLSSTQCFMILPRRRQTNRIFGTLSMPIHNSSLKSSGLRRWFKWMNSPLLNFCKEWIMMTILRLWDKDGNLNREKRWEKN